MTSKQGVNVLVAGVAVVDFVFRVETMPDRAEKYRALDAAVVGGGCAASAAVAVSRLGGHARLAARIGSDRIGAIIRTDLEAEGVDCHLLRSFENMRSPYASVLVDNQGERRIVSFRDPDMPAGASWLEAEIGDKFDVALADTRWPAGNLAVMAAARRLSRPGVVDAEPPTGPAMDVLRAASHIAFSALGLRDLTGRDDVAAALQEANRLTGAWVCVTDGPRGVTWLDGGKARTVMPPGVEVVDTLGAGDAWHGAFALALGEGRGELGAIEFANTVASLKCTRFGGRAGIPTRAEVDVFLAGQPA
ncbi:MAG: PfkB family carbohydrate kinase [Rhizobiaceae bacterium]